MADNQVTEKEKYSRFPGLDIFVRDYVRNLQPNPCIVRAFSGVSNRDIILYNVLGSNYCSHVNEQHTSKRIYYVASLNRAKLYQMCFECKGYRSEQVDIPKDLFFNTAEEQYLNDEFNKPIAILE